MVPLPEGLFNSRQTRGPRRLGIETIHLYCQHRFDPNVPIEETVGAMAELFSGE
jgi:aryl-alcohol dehydrogenase-like predicted oxidoreductase